MKSMKERCAEIADRLFMDGTNQTQRAVALCLRNAILALPDDDEVAALKAENERLRHTLLIVVAKCRDPVIVAIAEQTLNPEALGEQK